MENPKEFYELVIGQLCRGLQMPFYPLKKLDLWNGNSWGFLTSLLMVSGEIFVLLSDDWKKETGNGSPGEKRKCYLR